MTKRQTRRSECPIAYALDLLGDRWTLLVVRDLALKGRTSYGEFLAGGESISTNILAERLARLEAAGVITKQRDPEHGAKYIYRLTNKGVDLVPLILEIIRWSATHDPDTSVSKAYRCRLDRELRTEARQIKAGLLKGHGGRFGR